MNLFEPILDLIQQKSIGIHFYGVMIGKVTNNKDPESLGRVKIKFPNFGEKDESGWIRIATPMAGNGYGMYCLPEIDDEVLVAFEQGDVHFPYIIGSLWNGKDHPPEKNTDGKNHIRMIQSRSGHVIRFNDEPGKEKIEISDKSGKNIISIDSAKNTITVQSNQDIHLSAPQGTILLNAKNIEIKSSAEAKVNSGSGMNVEAGGNLNIKGSVINLN